MKQMFFERELDVDAIVISPAWPLYQSGYGIAIKSALKQYVRAFSKINFICLNEYPFTNRDEWGNEVCTWIHIPIVRGHKWKRFLKSLFKAFPAITMQYASRMIERQILEFITHQQRTGRKVVIIFEDVPTACLLTNIRRNFPLIPVAIRSHNVLSKAFEGFKYIGHPISRIAWTLELLKIQNYERKVCQMADRVWAISKHDSMEYLTRLGIRCHGIFGVSVDINRYKNVKARSIYEIICIGSADLRKGHGLHNFIRTSWKEIHNKIPKTQLILGGRDTQSFTNEKLRVNGLGFVNDDRCILNEGMIFVNPQEIGSGVKLKSIVAMLAGKALVSTRIGIEGIEGIDGEHFLVAEDVKGLAPLIIKLVNNEKLAKELGSKAREFALKIYSEKSLERYTKPIIDNFLSLTIKN